MAADAVDASVTRVSKTSLWAGRVISALPVALLLFSGVLKVAKPKFIIDGFTKYGFPQSQIVGIGILELACTVLYLIPKTSILGALLVTAYLGGATVTQLRTGQSWLMPVIAGILIWVGLLLRDARLRPLLPLTRQARAAS